MEFRGRVTPSSTGHKPKNLSWLIYVGMGGCGGPRELLRYDLGIAKVAAIFESVDVFPGIFFVLRTGVHVVCNTIWSQIH